MNLSQVARSSYAVLRRAQNSAAYLAQFQQEAETLALALATNPDAAFELTSSTVNGQTFSGQRSMTNGDRLEFLRLMIWQFENCQTLPTQTRAVF